jgi:hypothetical protein
MLGTIRLLFAVRVPERTRITFLAVDEAPLAIVIVVSASAIVTLPMPQIDSSRRVPRFVSVVMPQVPDCSPVAINSSLRFVENVLGINYLYAAI